MDWSRPSLLKQENLNEGRFSSFELLLSPPNTHHESFGKHAVLSRLVSFIRIIEFSNLGKRTLHLNEQSIILQLQGEKYLEGLPDLA